MKSPVLAAPRIPRSGVWRSGRPDRLPFWSGMTRTERLGRLDPIDDVFALQEGENPAFSPVRAERCHFSRNGTVDNCCILGFLVRVRARKPRFPAGRPEAERSGGFPATSMTFWRSRTARTPHSLNLRWP